MPGRLPLVLEGSQVEQLPVGDFIDIGKLNLGSPELILVTSNNILVSGSYVQVSSVSSITVDQINGGEDGDILVIQGEFITARIRFDFGGNITLTKRRDIEGKDNILTLLRTSGQWYEISWSG